MIVAFLSQKGGVGKSTLALSVAYEWMYRGRNVLLVDADPQGTCRVAADVSREVGHEAPTIIGMGATLHRPNELPKLAKSYDDVIIDTPAGVGEVPQAALMVTDVAIVPAAPGLDAWSVSRTVDLVKMARQGRRPDMLAAIVVARKIPGTNLGHGARKVLGEAGLPVFKAETCNRIAWSEAPLSGLGLTKYEPDAPAALELTAMVDELARFAKKPVRRTA
jgi:chromosome partitioning protein